MENKLAGSDEGDSFDSRNNIHHCPGFQLIFWGYG